MIDRQALLADLRPVVTLLEDDLRTRLEEHAPSQALVQADYDAAKKAGRTAQTLSQFRDDHVTQIAVAWVLATVFVRFVEDNGLCDEPWLSGPGRKLAQARDRYTQWLRKNPELSDREFLLHVFAELGGLPGLAPLLGVSNPMLHRIGPTADGARILREFWLTVDGEGDTAHLRHDFSDPAADTRFLGDLYQDLSEAAQKKFALLQTPIFVEEFILDRTLEPAISEFGLAEVRLIDPTCGSGHFLLGGFHRLFAQWSDREPNTPAQELATRSLAAVAGVDLNPFAVAIARFRLLVAALKVCGVHRLAEAYDFRPRVAAGDSLLHSVTAQGMTGVHQRDWTKQDELRHFYGGEDKELLREIFGRRYHAVVGNPPYIVARDKALNALYRANFPDVCHRKYSLGVPFTQAFFELARFETSAERQPPGFVGMITANSFMKREFGSKLIEQYLNKRVEVSHVLDLSGAYIPGHGTPTVILEGRPRTPTTQTIRAVLGIKGEPSTPDDPAKGLVWSAIVGQVDQPGSESDYVSCADVERARFATHPWSIGGGGAAELKEQIDEACDRRLCDFVESIGFASFPGADEVFLVGRQPLLRRGVAPSLVRTCLDGEAVRDWTTSDALSAFVPFDGNHAPIPLAPEAPWGRYLWPFRTTVGGTISFGAKTRIECGDQWWTWYRWVPSKYSSPLSITFAEVATHNHFVLDRGGKVFNRTAPVIKLPAGATEDDHLGLLGLLNSSTACFWLKQVCHNKGSTVDQHGARQRTAPFEDFYQLSGTRVQEFPVADKRPLVLAGRLSQLGLELGELLVQADLRSSSRIEGAAKEHRRHLAEAVAVQEELDWECYCHYGLTKEDLTFAGSDLPDLQLGQRAFEIALARQLAAGKSTTTWFDRHSSTPITEIPAHWPKAYRDLVQRRIDCIEKDADIRLIEQPEFKRRWNVEPFAQQLQRAQRSWLLDRMEDPKFWPLPKLLSTARLAEKLRLDPDFVQVSNLYRGRDDHDFDELVRELVESEAVPFLPVLRYKPSGLRKRSDWEDTWALQRREDAGEQVDSIPVPPKFTSADFLKSSYWKLRGKLDVPKERFILYPTAERSDDPTPVFTWAGFDHQQQAHALVARYVEIKDNDSPEPAQLIPLLAGLRELVPWLLQWHNDPTPEAPSGYGTAYQDFLAAELNSHELSEDDLRSWSPPAHTRRPRRVRRVTRDDEEDQA